MQRCNVMSCKCGDPSGRINHVSVTRGHHYFLCDKCQAALLKQISDRLLLQGMMKACMTSTEVNKMHNERLNQSAIKRLSEKVAEMFAKAGYPKHLALPEATAA